MIDGWLSAVAGADAADWLTFLAYLGTAALAWRASGKAMAVDHRREVDFWRLVALALALLGINELLDLQALLTDLGRAHAKAYGWYGNHRKVQYAFVIVLAGLAIVAGAMMLWLTRRTHPAVGLALVGLLFIGVFVLLRAASFHHLDDLLGKGPAQFNLAKMQEAVGIAIVALAAAAYARRKPRTRV